MTTALPAPDDQIGRYRLLREIGRGAMGVVFEAEPTHPGAPAPLGQRVALKLLIFPPLLPESERDGLILRFAREARALASVRHLNVVRVYEVDQADGQPYLVMDYLSGLNSREWLLRSGPMSPERVLRYGTQLCDALEAVHAAGIIHRDIKPDNVVIEPDETIRLTDFGIARMEVEASLTRTGGLIGSPAYMAPEQITGGPVDTRADLFSVGVTLYQMLSGDLPFQGSSLMEVAHRVAYDPPRPLTGVPSALAAVLLQALEKDPERRYPTAAAFRNALLRCRDANADDSTLDVLAAEVPHGGDPVLLGSKSVSGSIVAGPVPLIAPPSAAAETCSYHAGRKAVAHCADCEAPLCTRCSHHRRGQIWCPAHASPRTRPAWLTRLEVLAIGLLFALLLWSLYPIHW